MTKFDGPIFDKNDQGRISKQLDEVRKLMLDGTWRTLGKIQELTGFPQASISARLRDLRKEKFGGFTVDRDRVMRGLYIYRVMRKNEGMTQ